jgi:hypothetical protein
MRSFGPRARGKNSIFCHDPSDMTKLLIGLSALSLLLATSPPDAAQVPKPKPETTNDTKPKPRATTIDLTLFVVPWGMHYTRAAWGTSLAFRAPLVKKPGVLWDSTNIAFGVRDVYGYVNNTAGIWAEITPIAVFKVQVQASYDYFIKAPFNGGMRVLTQHGRDLLAAGQMQEGSSQALDWSKDEGLDNRANFLPPVYTGGLRFRVMPTLQGKLGNVAFQYNFTADWNRYSAPGASKDDVFHDNFTFTLRKLHDFDHMHELVVAYSVPVAAPGEMLFGLTGQYRKALGTGLDRLSVNALFFLRYPRKIFGGRMSPFVGGNVGTNLIDPMWRYAFSWILVVGGDFNLYTDGTKAAR